MQFQSIAKAYIPISLFSLPQTWHRSQLSYQPSPFLFRHPTQNACHPGLVYLPWSRLIRQNFQVVLFLILICNRKTLSIVIMLLHKMWLFFLHSGLQPYNYHSISNCLWSERLIRDIIGLLSQFNTSFGFVSNDNLCRGVNVSRWELMWVSTTGLCGALNGNKSKI